MLSLFLVQGQSVADTSNYFANEQDKQLTASLVKRGQDWRNGALVYQVLVDRYAPSKNLDKKRDLYASPKVLKSWDEVPKGGHYLEDAQVWSHEIEFWGGDLDSLKSKLDHIQRLGMDVLYLNPIHYGFTNHKYDALDYKKVSPEFGDREDVKALADELHRRGMKLVLDGVFNHMGRNAEIFKQASKDQNSPYRDWFYFGEQYPSGHRAWASAINLPELNLENPAVREHVYNAPNSVVQGYLLDEGIDGWRLDVAFDIGFRYLTELTQAAHQAKPGALVVGEIWNYPKEWFPAIDGIMNFSAREVLIRTIFGDISPAMAVTMLDRMVSDAGIEPMLKSWLVLDNHDTPRLKNLFPELWQQQMAQVLQFSFPGSPNVYYGVEVGMTGGIDPEMRAPMRWDWVKDDNPSLVWLQNLIDIRKTNRALRIGEFRVVNSEKLVAFERYTDTADETIVVLANPGTEDVSESVMIANSKLMNATMMTDLLGVIKEPVQIWSGLIRANVPAGKTVMLKVQTAQISGYTPYKRVK
ncbi:glycoside hydrolase family 13 protein [Paraneptunicella aestuarii]|nr:glycoside hydrolase family 13 protein [Paraneptunicella aestuarii]